MNYFINKEKKIVPVNIEKIITPVVLAYLIMGDGNLKLPDKITRLYTNSFLKEEVNLLAKSRIKKLDIKTKVIHDRNNQYIITMNKNELPKIQNLIKNHMHPSMYYKINMKESEFHSFNYDNINLFSQSAKYYGDILNNYS